MIRELVIQKINGHSKSGKVGKIKVEVGQQIGEKDILCTVEAGKGTQNIESKYEGKILELNIEEGDEVEKGYIIGKIEAIDKIKDEVKSVAKKETMSYSFGIKQTQKEEISCDLLIVGGGPGGYVAAVRAAQEGLNTIVIEKESLGGTCLNHGCIPTKALAHSASVLGNIKDSEIYGFEVPQVEINFSQVMNRKKEVVSHLVGGIKSLMNHHNIKVIKGEAVAKSTYVMEVKEGNKQYSINYKNLIIATGSLPAKLNIEGANLEQVITSKEALQLEKIPKSLAIIGGGVIGMEMAFIYNAMGTKVSVIEFADTILPTLDEDVIEVIRKNALDKGIKVYEKVAAQKISESLTGDVIVTVLQDGKEKYLNCEKVLMSVGRKANVEALDLKTLGVELNERKNGIQVDEYLKTNVERIYAIGDVTNKCQLAHVASEQGLIAVDHIAGGNKAMTYDLIPSAIFTNPEIGTIGMSEKKAKSEGVEYKIAKFPFEASGKAVAMNETEGFVKLIIDSQEERVIGGSIVGGHGTDMVALIGQLVKDRVSLESASDLVYAHPTLAESIHEALLIGEGKGIHFG